MTPPVIDFARLTLRDALDVALLIEEDAKARYVDLMANAMLHDSYEAAEFFGHMAGHEEKHAEVLARRRTELFGDQPTTVTPAMVSGIEQWTGVAPGPLSGRAALQMALRAERAAWKFFSMAIPRLIDEAAVKLFVELRDEEIMHQRMVLDQLEKTPPESSLKAAV
ncbi:MAG TPA: ferritin family protein [Myxococcales bacterium]|nr:ferritin family protein [Myxococcales bacterium]